MSSKRPSVRVKRAPRLQFQYSDSIGFLSVSYDSVDGEHINFHEKWTASPQNSGYISVALLNDYIEALTILKDELNKDTQR